ncbi:MAG TPA: hypothetical protein DCM87_04650 [Planctomycetes bacterium]|nr:hypothetical protein [Planctomycetota bacterium]
MGVDIGAHEAGGCERAKIMFARGDVNADGKRDVADAVSVLQFLFSGGQTPLCLKAADTNDSGRVNVADAIYLLSFIFAHGARPPAPFPGCGIDLTLDELPCESFLPCMAAE